MKGKVFWLLASYLVVLSLVLAACAPKAPEVTPTAPKEVVPTAPKEALPTAPKETVAPAAEVPKYGGTVVIPSAQDMSGFDQIYLSSRWQQSQTLPYEFLLQGDWARGPAGSDETDFMDANPGSPGFFDHTGAIAESWEIPDDQTMIFKIRQGVHWHDKPPVNGREVDANDVAYSIRYMYLNPKLAKTYNVVASAPGGLKLLSAEATDKWTVVVKVEGMSFRFFEDVAMAKGTHIIARESIEKYGDLRDWRNSLGTGAFMLIDYVPASSLTFVRNPNYWQQDPAGPGKGNQLPYLDGVKVLIISDKSTVFSGFRTGKIEMVADATLAPETDEFQGILKTNPATKGAIDYGESNHIGARTTSTDPRAAPMKNRRVRQALVMAIDYNGLVNDFYGGNAAKRAVFFHDPNRRPYISDDEVIEILQTVFGLPPEEAQIIKKMYGYNPEEAKKILAEEGYPNGFNTMTEIEPAVVEEISLVKGFWEKIGVNLELNVKQFAVWRSYVDTHQFPAMNVGGTLTAGGPAQFIGFGPSNPDPKVPRNISNRLEITDPTLSKWMQKVEAVYSDYQGRTRLLQETEAWILYNAWSTYLPVPYVYYIWQPWLKNYYGMSSVGFKATSKWTYYAWYDQELKKQMGYK